MTTCKSAKCDRPIYGSFYCEGCHQALWVRMTNAAQQISDAATKLYGGRSAAPEQRLLQHLDGGHYLSCLSILHWAFGLEEADSFERRMLEHLRISREVLNHDKDKGGTGDRTGYFHAIYVAWAPKPGVSLSDFVFIEDFSSDPGRRVWPVQTPNFEAVHLRSSLTPQGGRVLAAELKQKRDDYAKSRGR